MDSDERDSRSMHTILRLFKIIVLVLCVPLHPDEARRLYREMRSGFSDRAHDPEFPISPAAMVFYGLREIAVLLPRLVRKFDLERTIYNFADVPMRMFVVYAMPGGALLALTMLTGGADAGTATLVGLVAVSVFWVVAVVAALRRRINDDTDDAETPVPMGNPDRVVTVPNVLSAVRLVVGAPLFVLMVVTGNLGGAAFVLLFCGVTDWLDGNLARKWGQVTRVGRALDRMADRAVMFAVAGTFIAVGGPVPIWLMFCILVRETVMVLATIVLYAFGAKPIAVVWWGKVGCALVVIGMTIVLFPNIQAMWLNPHGGFGQSIQLVGAIVTVVGFVFKVVATAYYARAIPTALAK